MTLLERMLSNAPRDIQNRLQYRMYIGTPNMYNNIEPLFSLMDGARGPTARIHVYGITHVS